MNNFNQQLEDTGFHYQFNYANNTADIFFGGVKAGTMFIPYLNAKTMHTEWAIELLRTVEKAYVRYNRRITNRA